MIFRVFASGGGLWGLGHDSRIVESVIRQLQLRLKLHHQKIQVEHCDPVTWMPTGPADVHIYLEHPFRLAMSWARYNVAVVNPEWWPATAWDWGVKEMDLFVFKSEAAARLFPEVPERQCVILPWRSDMAESHTGWQTRENRFLYVIGGSVNKAHASKTVVAAWQPVWPTLEIWCSPGIADELRSLVPPSANVIFQTEYRSAKEREARQRACKWHVVTSVGEGFGFTMAEAAACGAPVLWAPLPVQEERWGAVLRDVGRCRFLADATAPIPAIGPCREPLRVIDPFSVGPAVESLLTLANVTAIQKAYHNARVEALHAFVTGWERVLRAALRNKHDPLLPTAPPKGQVPKVGIVTVTRNRAEWWPNMVANVTGQRWPLSRMEWIIVDDSDPAGRVDGKVAELQSRVPELTVRYVSLTGGPYTVGDKRNRACASASADVEVFVMMDDDDHYPPGSVSSRVSWLTTGRQAVYCAAIPMYDVPRYTSAMNVPPLALPVNQRLSEATLTFTRRFWEERGFPNVSMAEGEGFLEGREGETVEIASVGVIVSFIHKGNTSSRRTPEAQEPNGSHYGFTDEFFRFLCSVGGAT